MTSIFEVTVEKDDENETLGMFASYEAAEKHLDTYAKTMQEEYEDDSSDYTWRAFKTFTHNPIHSSGATNVVILTLYPVQFSASIIEYEVRE